VKRSKENKGRKRTKLGYWKREGEERKEKSNNKWGKRRGTKGRKRIERGGEGSGR